MNHLHNLRLFFFFNDTATTEIYTLSLHDALPISRSATRSRSRSCPRTGTARTRSWARRSEEHTSELQSRPHLVCRPLLAKNASPASQCPSSAIPTPTLPPLPLRDLRRNLHARQSE